MKYLKPFLTNQELDPILKKRIEEYKYIIADEGAQISYWVSTGSNNKFKKEYRIRLKDKKTCLKFKESDEWEEFLIRLGENLPIHFESGIVDNDGKFAFYIYSHISNKHIKPLTEVIKLDINVGDVVLGGRFKNKKIKVKKIGKNKKGDLTLNGKPLLRFRIIDQESIKEKYDYGDDEYDLTDINKIKKEIENILFILKDENIYVKKMKKYIISKLMELIN